MGTYSLRKAMAEEVSLAGCAPPGCPYSNTAWTDSLPPRQRPRTRALHPGRGWPPRPNMPPADPAATTARGLLEPRRHVQRASRNYLAGTTCAQPILDAPPVLMLRANL